MIPLTILALLGGASASPFVVRQAADAASSVSSATQIEATGSAATAIAPGQTPITAISSVAAPSASSTGGGSGNGSSSTGSSAPNVTFWPFSETGESVTAYGRSLLGVDTYYGIPFAKPPVDDLRFTAPQDAVWNTTTFNATTPPAACLQAPNAMYGRGGYSEDCLYLNVQAPAGYDSSKAPIPVMVWVYGGSFTSGDSVFYDSSLLLTQAVRSEKPIIFVSLNYRLGIFGFANGDEAAENGAANLGLRDVQKALEWVQANIWAWGGDPEQVTLFGQSAGAILVSLLYLQPELDLFKQAIMHSGAQSTAPLTRTAENWQAPYDALVQFAGCDVTAVSNATVGANGTSAVSGGSDMNSTDVGGATGGVNATNPIANGTNAAGFSSSFDCLRALPADQLLGAQERTRSITQYQLAFVFAPSVDGDLIPDSPHKLLANGQFAKKPFISGNVKDEGTGFIPTTLPFSNDTFIAAAFASIEPIPLDLSILQELFTTVYPDIPSLGSPFGTGNETFGIGPEYKQLAAILGDAAFQANRRWFLQQSNAHGLDQTWTYLFESAPPATPARLGVFHSADVLYLFGLPQLAQLNLTSAPGNLAGPLALANAYNFTAADAVLSTQLINYWLNFAYYSDPNGNGNGDAATAALNATQWPAYGGETNMLSLKTLNVSLITDDYRQEQMQFFLDRPVDFNYKRDLHA